MSMPHIINTNTHIDMWINNSQYVYMYLCIYISLYMDVYVNRYKDKDLCRPYGQDPLPGEVGASPSAFSGARRRSRGSSRGFSLGEAMHR